MKTAYYSDNIWYDSKLYPNSWLIVDGGTVECVTDDISKYSGIKRKEFKNSAIFPGLINTHTHLGMSLFRGMSDDLPLMVWLRDHIWPAEAKHVSAEFVYTATKLAAAESIRSGVTCANDMYFFANSAKSALNDVGMRAVIGFGIMGSFDKALQEADAFVQDDFIKLSICPHALYTVSPELYRKCVDYVIKKDIRLHTHLAETTDEVEQIVAKYGKTPALLMADTGALDCKSIFAHCVHLTDEEIAIMGRSKAGISHCLDSNLKLASGFAPISKLIASGANVSIGTDGAASNNDQSVLTEMSVISKFHKAFSNDVTALPARQVLDMATVNAAKALHFEGIGSLKAGNKADFFVLSFDAAHMTPMYDPVSHLIYAAQPSDITDVYIDGKPVMTDSEIVTFDENELKTEARNIAKNIG